MPLKRKYKQGAVKEREQLKLLRQILAELQILNSNLMLAKTSNSTRKQDSDEDELEEFE